MPQDIAIKTSGGWVSIKGPQGDQGTTDHGALTGLADDDHGQYHTDARGDARYSPLGHSHAYDPAGTAAAAVSAHAAASDPHPGYLTPDEGDAAYEPKSANIQAHIASAANPHGVTAAQAGADPAGTSASAIAAHIAASDPHPTYTTTAEAAAAAPVQSVAGKTGVVSLAIADTSGLQAVLDGKAATGHSHSGLAPSGGTTGQVLAKGSSTDFDTTWVDPPTGGGGGSRFRVGATFVNPQGLTLPVNDVPAVLPTDCTVRAVFVMATGGAGAFTLDIWKITYSQYPPAAAQSICGSNKPAFDGVLYYDFALNGWTTALLENDVLLFHLEVVSGNLKSIDITLILEPVS